VPPARGGERSQRPGVQARLQLGTDDPDDACRGAIAVSGHMGWERPTQERTVRGLDKSWAIALDFAARRDRIGVAGEVFTGNKLDAFGGALGLDRKVASGWPDGIIMSTGPHL